MPVTLLDLKLSPLLIIDVVDGKRLCVTKKFLGLAMLGLASAGVWVAGLWLRQTQVARDRYEAIFSLRNRVRPAFAV